MHQILIALYGGTPGQSLHELRYDCFARSMTKSKFNLASLPPTKAAARQHSFRSYHQVQQWLDNKKNTRAVGLADYQRQFITCSHIARSCSGRTITNHLL